MSQQIIDLEISASGAAPGAANMKPMESIGFSRGRQSLDHSVWYNGSLMTFLATGEDTHGQFALIEAVARKGNVPPPHVHHREDEIFYVLEGEIVVRSAIAQSRERPERWFSYPPMCRTRSQSNQSRAGCSFCLFRLGWCSVPFSSSD